MKSLHFSLMTAVAIAAFGITVPAQADTVDARCDVYPKGEDRAKSSGLCTFSQRQDVVGIQLQNGKRYDLTPVGSQPGNYKDQNGQAAYRQSGLGDKGQIYRLTSESIFVYWDTAPYGKNSNNTTAGSATAAASHPDAGTSVDRLSDLVGAKAGQSENALKQRGYQFIKNSSASDAVYSYWREAKTNYCVTIRTEQGRYASIVYATPADCER